MNLVAQNYDAGSVFQAGSEFDEFLFAPVIAEANGMTLSVLSMLARADLDPRSEAAELARLPTAKATDALASFIGGLPQGPVARCDTETVAARLAALLPRRPNAASAVSQTKIGNRSLTPGAAVAIAAILICFLVGTIWAAAGRQLLARTGGPLPAASAGVIAPMRPPHAVR
jgi:hypothetical protein